MKIKLVESANSYIDEVILDFEQSDRSVEGFTKALNTVSQKEYDGEIDRDKYDEAIKKLQELYKNRNREIKESDIDSSKITAILRSIGEAIEDDSDTEALRRYLQQIVDYCKGIADDYSIELTLDDIIEECDEEAATQPEDIAKKEEYNIMVTPTFKRGKKIKEEI